jgi:hypothetical protein
MRCASSASLRRADLRLALSGRYAFQDCRSQGLALFVFHGYKTIFILKKDSLILICEDGIDKILSISVKTILIYL